MCVCARSSSFFFSLSAEIKANIHCVAVLVFFGIYVVLKSVITALALLNVSVLSAGVESRPGTLPEPFGIGFLARR